VTDTLPALPQFGQAGISVADLQNYGETVDFSRALRTLLSDYQYHLLQIGRLRCLDDFESTLQWINASGSGTLAVDATTYLRGTQSVKLTTAAGAGDQVIARKFFGIMADQGSKPTPLIGAEIWFKPFDNNLRDVQLFVRVDDATTKWEAAVRFWKLQAGVQENEFQYLDLNGNYQNLDNYVIPTPAGNVADPWHFMGIYMNYHQGLSAGPGYYTYAAAIFDDFTYAFPQRTSAHNIATSSVRETNVDFLITSDNATGTVVNADQFVLADLSGIYPIGGVQQGVHP
jgi:hypothetical protein